MEARAFTGANEWPIWLQLGWLEGKDCQQLVLLLLLLNLSHMPSLHMSRRCIWCREGVIEDTVQRLQPEGAASSETWREGGGPHRNGPLLLCWTGEAWVSNTFSQSTTSGYRNSNTGWWWSKCKSISSFHTSLMKGCLMVITYESHNTVGGQWISPNRFEEAEYWNVLEWNSHCRQLYCNETLCKS